MQNGIELFLSSKKEASAALALGHPQAEQFKVVIGVAS